MRAEFENPRFQQENRLPARSVMLPAQVTGVDYRTKENSDRVQSLCGTWKFLFIEDDFDYIDGSGDITAAPAYEHTNSLHLLSPHFLYFLKALVMAC